MSAYAEYNSVQFKDLPCLIEALQKCRNRKGIPWTLYNLVISENNDIDLYGYEGKNRSTASGQNRSPKCSIAIAGAGRPGCLNAVGSSSNDLGFTRDADGNLAPVISSYDSTAYDECWMNELKATYLEVLVNKNAKKNGYKVKKTEVDGKVKLTMTRWR